MHFLSFATQGIYWRVATLVASAGPLSTLAQRDALCGLVPPIAGICCVLQTSANCVYIYIYYYNYYCIFKLYVCNAMPCNAMQCHAMPCNAMQCNVTS